MAAKPIVVAVKEADLDGVGTLRLSELPWVGIFFSITIATERTAGTAFLDKKKNSFVLEVIPYLIPWIIVLYI
jgi:hypothetical protein